MTSSVAQRNLGFVWQCPWRCVPTVSKGERKNEDGREKLSWIEAGSCQTLAVPEFLREDGQRPTWGVLVSESMDDLNHAAPCWMCVCLCTRLYTSQFNSHPPCPYTLNNRPLTKQGTLWAPACSGSQQSYLHVAAKCQPLRLQTNSPSPLHTESSVLQVLSLTKIILTHEALLFFFMCRKSRLKKKTEKLINMDEIKKYGRCERLSSWSLNNLKGKMLFGTTNYSTF